MLRDKQRAHLSKSEADAEKNELKPEFRIALVFDMSRIESSIATEQERSQRSLEHRGLETPEVAGSNGWRDNSRSISTNCRGMG